jgi:hypothetical protein
LLLRDGSRVQYVSYLIGGSIQQAGKRSAGVFHEAQERYGIEHFASRGYRIFPRHIAVDGVKGWADFAAARYRRVILVECMTDWWVDSTIKRKAELASACELWFIAEPGGMDELRKLGYICEVMPCADSEAWRDLKTTFWICRPDGARNL